MGIRQHVRNHFRKKHNICARELLTNLDATVFSSNCVGGVISHDLDLRFNSPTINLFMYPADYLRFLGNLPYYLSLEPKQIDVDSPYPVGMLDDVRVDFVHYSCFLDAFSAWERRCERVDLTNCCAIMVDRDGCTYDQAVPFSNLPFECKAFLTAAPLDLSCAVSNPDWLEPNGQQTRDLCAFKNCLSTSRWIDDFDVVDFLNNAGGIIDCQ